MTNPIKEEIKRFEKEFTKNTNDIMGMKSITILNVRKPDKIIDFLLASLTRVREAALREVLHEIRIISNPMFSIDGRIGYRNAIFDLESKVESITKVISLQ